MKNLLLLCSLAALVSCTTVPMQQSVRRGKARVTFYNPFERDRMRVRKGRRFVWRWITWGRRTASGISARQGITCAASKKFPIGCKIKLPLVKPYLGTDTFVVQDRGGGAKKFGENWIDLFVDNREIMRRLAAILPEWMDYQIQ